MSVFGSADLVDCTIERMLTQRISKDGTTSQLNVQNIHNTQPINSPDGRKSSTNLVQSNLLRQCICSHRLFNRRLRLHRTQLVCQSVTFQSVISQMPEQQSLRYSHIISPRHISAEKTRKMSETMMRFCCWCKIRTPNRSPTRTYAQVNNDHSTTCRRSVSRKKGKTIRKSQPKNSP
jgi:hypothetical protein